MNCPGCRRLIVEIATTRVDEREAIARTLRAVFNDSLNPVPTNDVDKMVKHITSRAILRAINIILDETIRV
jgi:hypothetical protein